MKNRKEKGITLMTLAIAVIIILIITSISITTGIDTVNMSQFMSFQSELSLVQSKVNEITLQYQRENKTLGGEITDKEMEILETEEVSTILQQKASDRKMALEDLKKGFHLCSKEYIAQELGLNDLKRDYLINLESTIVVAVQKLNFEGKNYYMLEQIQSSTYNVSYNNQIKSDGTFNVTVTHITNAYQIKIETEHDKYVSKWEVRYKLQKKDDWKTTDSLTFNVETPGIYEIQVLHGEDVNLGTQTVTIKAGEPNENGYFTEKSTINGRKDSTAYNPLIPKGFKPIEDETTPSAVWGEGSEAPTREAVNSGLVIQNEEGSQYVWVPVDGVDIKLSRYIFDENGNAVMQGENIINSYYQELAASTVGNSTAQNIREFKQSVQKNGGYYIARYEASKGENGRPVSIKSQGIGSSDNVAKGMLWNWASQNEASGVCQNLYTEIKSDLINSYAWDTAITFIQNKNSENNKYSNKIDGKGEIKNTGETNDVACNIYDMSGNMLEWTTETSNEMGKPYVARGGSYIDSSTNTSSRISQSEESANISFRPILYW